MKISIWGDRSSVRSYYRALLLIFGTLTALSFPSAVDAASSRVGIVIPEARRSEAQVIKGVRDELKILGHEDGKDLTIEVYDAKGDRSALKTMLSKITTARFDVLLTTGTRTTLAAKELTRDIPIVFTHPADPVAAGLVESLNHPGANITGIAGLSLQMNDMRLTLLKEIMPKLQRILIFYDAGSQSSRDNFMRSQNAALQMGIQTVPYGIKAAEELKATLLRLDVKPGDALFHIADDLLEGEAEFVLDVAREKKLPSIFNDDRWASLGALASYGPSYYQMGLQAARLVNKILAGQKAGMLPVERVNKFDFVINYRTVRAVGLVIPPAVLKKADRIIR